MNEPDSTALNEVIYDAEIVTTNIILGKEERKQLEDIKMDPERKIKGGHRTPLISDLSKGQTTEEKFKSMEAPHPLLLVLPKMHNNGYYRREEDLWRTLGKKIKHFTIAKKFH